jgi:hypothetical protein
MTDDPFEACWYRWERADSRCRDMVKVWNDYVERQPSRRVAELIRT